MKRFAAVVSYDGTDFFGFQNQPDMRTVQGVFEEALERIHKFSISSQGAGRTDTGVHGYGQVIAFDSNLDRLSASTMKDALNANLPSDVYVRKVHEVTENFSPRFAANKRIYHYYILNSSEPDIFRRRFVWWFPYPLDIESMRRAGSHLLGEHDFAAFRTGKDDRNPVRTVSSIRIIKVSPHLILIRVEGISFLKRMVRNIVGTLVKVGTGGVSEEAVAEFLSTRDRSSLPGTAPPQGLVFYKVVFDEFET
ncbi:MAG TPA: tRNA pseudouridine(38-40) synthase TruA [Mesotoga infera]|jgi:tRNA pseudouridine38-40 synthase|uniref:tRNA pseudouridine synthase A n=1 Tax=Mesotoga infera TaxID=1236046 RepID=A0A101I996_9BACT|nr:MAG: tRNA pseudouridine synthase A [Mesotoga infera]KUK91008.1 MAG: tRNA pseudouridine synthase A [Mesotoga infera]HCO70171.1 tRNA pseudouridine(38-40) synthase TruA [Mesotoga infera]